MNISNTYLIIDSLTNQITNIIVADFDFAKTIGGKPYYNGAEIGQQYNPPINYDFQNVSDDSVIQSGSYIGTVDLSSTTKDGDFTITSIDTEMIPEIAYISTVDGNQSIVINIFEEYKLKVSNKFNQLGIKYKYTIIGKRNA